MGVMTEFLSLLAPIICLLGLVSHGANLTARFFGALWGGQAGPRSSSYPLFLLELFLFWFFAYEAAELFLRAVARPLGRYLQRQTLARRKLIFSRLDNAEAAAPAEKQTKAPPGRNNDESRMNGLGLPKPSEWKGIVGFFHPFCNAGGGGERVLWAAVKATQDYYPHAVCVVYTGDHEVTRDEIIDKVKMRFNIKLNASRLLFLYLSTRHYVLASTWPRFTLLGQSLGSLVLALDAFSLLVPDVFIDTMGYAYSLALSSLCFPEVPTAAYVHYPTISTDMLGSLDATDARGVNAGSGRGLRGRLKKIYWRLFAKSYGWAGGHVDIVMANSSWTQAHVRSLWTKSRSGRGKTSPIEVLFPPVAVGELEQAIEISPASESKREKSLVYIAQFRPEKNHGLIIDAFAEFLRKERADSGNSQLRDAKLVLIGSVRDSRDEKEVYKLRLQVRDLKIEDRVVFVVEAAWPEILKRLGKSSVGVNGMWNEHFGIGVVEYQAAGLISVVNDSGGPKLDIVVDYDGGPTGFHAASVSEYAEAYSKALSLKASEALAMRKRARESAKRFSEEKFANGWLQHARDLVALHEEGLHWSRQPLGFFQTLAALTFLYWLTSDIWQARSWQIVSQ